MKSLNRLAEKTRSWQAMGARTCAHIVSKGGRVVLQSARASDGGRATRAAVCRLQRLGLGRGTSNTRPYNYQTRK